MKWDAGLYDNSHDYVSANGTNVVELLDPKGKERILDVGCGTGELASSIQSSGATVVGVDSSPDMIAQAKVNYPDVEFKVQDAAHLSFEDRFDAVFSNAALHWVLDADRAVGSIYDCLIPNGRFIFEMGGKRNVAGIRAAIKNAAQSQGVSEHFSDDFWYFPSVSEYSAILEQHGFEVQNMSYFERPTPLIGDDGMRNWIDMFGAQLLSNLPNSAKEKIVNLAIEDLKPTHLREGVWYADYVRLRGKAIKVEKAEHLSRKNSYVTISV